MNIKRIIARLSMFVRYGIIDIREDNPFDEPWEEIVFKFVDGKTLTVCENYGDLGTVPEVVLEDKQRTTLCYWRRFYKPTETPDYHDALETFAAYSRYLKVLLK